ncbi:MAG TPA: UbiD family decarboxylase [Vicinamibacteria bacterium]|nr:UbiD family decarboxylase [Vicinamibacteria bacterium]
MGYKSLAACVADLERHGHLVRVREEVNPYLEMAEIQRRAYVAGAPALLFEQVKGCRFSCVSNLFGTLDRARFIFRDSLDAVKRIVQIKADPASAWRRPLTLAAAPFTAVSSLPRHVGRAPVLRHRARIEDLPHITSWPDDGGPFVTLPQVYTEHPDSPGVGSSNLGMYRIQLSGNRYRTGIEVGLHYQIHRGIGVHHAAAVRRGEPLRASVFVGGPPAHTLAAVMPLPEGLSELLFAGMLNRRRFRFARAGQYVVSADADFVITGSIDPERTLPEGPFGDHLGYYSLTHEFPVLEVEAVFHREGALWPFTVVGRPPQEDTSFGKLIHEITEPLVPVELPGVKAIHAVDAAGVHPLLLAIGSERYVPYGERVPQEILTCANALLGFGQCSLAKYLFIVAHEDDPALDVHDVEAFLRHALERVDLTRDLHFQTRTTIDTLDYSGTGLNAGSKLVIAAAGRKKRELATEAPDGLARARTVFPGVLVLETPRFRGYEEQEAEMEALSHRLSTAALEGFPLIVLVDDAEQAAESLRNFLWVTFTRSNPSHDVHGVESFSRHKHWGCQGPLIIDARLKPHHAPPLEEDPTVSKRVDALASRGKSLHGIL